MERPARRPCRLAGEDGVSLLPKALLQRAPRAPGGVAERWAADLWALVCMAHQRSLWDPAHQDLLQRAAAFGRSPAFDALPAAWWWPRPPHRPMSSHELAQALEQGWLSPLDGLDRSGTAVEPVQALRRWPVPSTVAKGLPADLGQRASLFHFLNVFCAAPARVLWGPATPDECLALAIFAAACLLAPQSLPGVVHGPPMSPGRRFAQGPARAGAETNAGLAVDWLCRQLPARGFQPGLEERIAQAMHQRYAGPAAAPRRGA